MNMSPYRLSMDCPWTLQKLARPPRLERGTLGLEGRCSIQLSYGREEESVYHIEFEGLTVSQAVAASARQSRGLVDLKILFSAVRANRSVPPWLGPEDPSNLP